MKGARTMAGDALRMSASDRWFTPPDLLARIAAFFADDYYDPCPARVAGESIESGLWAAWRGRVYVNPPYGRAIVPWVRKAVTEPLDELLLLLPARTDTAWFQPVWALDICFIRGRLRFSGHTENAPFPSVLAYRGPRRDEFALAFRDLGHIVMSERSADDGE
jgi:site-specific DNA-methyltransferase (adenine-specific)